MVTKKLVERLRQTLAGMGQKYESAWLTYNDDLTGHERYVLHVKIQPDVPSLFAEMTTISRKLRESLDPDSLRFVSRVDVHDQDERVQGWNDDIIVLEKDEAV